MAPIKYGLLQAAFRHRQHGKIVPTGAIHDTDHLPVPAHQLNHFKELRAQEGFGPNPREDESLAREKMGLDDWYAEWEPGFVLNKDPGRFLSRKDAAKLVGARGHLEASGYDAQHSDPSLERHHGGDQPSSFYDDPHPTYTKKSEYTQKIASLQKNLEDLFKVEPELSQHLRRLRQVAPESARYLARKLFVDHMTGVGNKAAYEDFLTRPHRGVHVVIDGNSLSSLNKIHGQSAGDDAIKAMFGAIKRASHMFRGKTFRIGGDEGHAFFETPEQAHGFVRQARAEMEKLAPIRGTHKVSASMGLGGSVADAEQALIHAKTAKKATGKLPGQEDTHAHSLLPGAVGPVLNKTPTSAPVTP